MLSRCAQVHRFTAASTRFSFVLAGVQVWANTEACRIKSMMAHLAKLLKATGESRLGPAVLFIWQRPLGLTTLDPWRSQKIRLLKNLLQHFQSQA